MAASLFVIRGRDQGKRYKLAGPTVSLGREKSNVIQLHDDEVSRRHAELHVGDDGCELVDLKSSNGIFVNGEKITSRALQSGDRLQIGRTWMLYTASASSKKAPLSGGDIDIVAKSPSDDDGSRIVSSVTPEEGSRVFDFGEEHSDPWLARARSNLQVMYRTALAVSHTLDIDQLLHRIMELIFEWVEADRGCVMLVDQESGELLPAVRRNRGAEQDNEAIEISRTILDYVTQNNEGVLTSDARADQRWDAGASIVKMGVREAICVPMQGRYDVVGVIYIDTYTPPGRLLQAGRSNKFSDDHLKLMVAIAHQAALAVEDTSYYSALLQAERMAAIGQTIATLSHHIKNILQGIRGGSYLIEEGLKDEDNEIVRKGWSIVDKNQEKISNLVLDMLTFSKERKPDMAPNDLNQVACDVVELMQIRAAESNVELLWRPDAALPILTFDSDGLHRAILNLVANAIDACVEEENGRVIVDSQYAPTENVVRIIVEDNGAGIDADDLKKVFTIFVSRKGNRGTGLGLPVSQKIIREHDGEIHVTSEPGAGSRFVLEMPAVIPRSTADQQSITSAR